MLLDNLNLLVRINLNDNTSISDIERLIERVKPDYIIGFQFSNIAETLANISTSKIHSEREKHIFRVYADSFLTVFNLILDTMKSEKLLEISNTELYLTFFLTHKF